MRILVAEDEPDLAEMLAEGLRLHAIDVDIAPDGARALERLADDVYDVLVLDRDLPEVHGDDVCRELARRDTKIGVLMLTASGTVRDRVAGLDLGADDYLAKPFAFAELLARIRALGRRRVVSLPPVLERAGITLDVPRRQAVRGGRYLPLSRKEFAVLEVLMRAQGTVVTAEQLLEHAWDEDINPFTTTVRGTVRKLRAKLGPPSVITTVAGGYRL